MLIGLSFLERPYLVLDLNFIPILHVNRRFTPCKLAIYRYDLQVENGDLQQCKSAIYSSVNRRFTVNERPLAEDGNPSGLNILCNIKSPGIYLEEGFVVLRERHRLRPFRARINLG